MSYYLFKAGDKVWRGVCSGACPRGLEWSVLHMRMPHPSNLNAMGLEVGLHHKDVGPLGEQFWKGYSGLLNALFGYKRPDMLRPLFGCNTGQYDPIIPMTSFTIAEGPQAAQHAIWQVLRQIAYRPHCVIACVEEYAAGCKPIPPAYAGPAAVKKLASHKKYNTALALKLWHRHLQLGSYTGENLGNIPLDNFVRRFNSVVNCTRRSRYMNNYTSAVFQND